MNPVGNKPYTTRVDGKNIILSQNVKIGGTNFTVTLEMNKGSADLLKEGDLSKKMSEGVEKMKRLAIVFNLGHGKAEKLTWEGGQLTRKGAKDDDNKSYSTEGLQLKVKNLTEKAKAAVEGKDKDSYIIRQRALRAFLTSVGKDSSKEKEVEETKKDDVAVRPSRKRVVSKDEVEEVKEEKLAVTIRPSDAIAIPEEEVEEAKEEKHAEIAQPSDAIAVPEEEVEEAKEEKQAEIANFLDPFSA